MSENGTNRVPEYRPLRMIQQTKRWAYLTVGFIALGLGILGIPLPLLPTTPFLLLAALCFARGSERWYRWLLDHKTFGPPIHAWREHRAVPRRVKWIGLGSLVVLPLISILGGAPHWLTGLQTLILLGVNAILWTRPEPPATT